MDMLSICRICLVEDVTMYTVVNTKLRDLYEKLTAMPFQMADSRPLQVCYICRARLQSCYRLQLSCLRSENLLAKMVASNQLESKWLLSANTLGIVHPLVQLSCVPVTEEVHHDDQDHHVVKPINMADVHIKEEHLEDTEELYPAPVDIVKVEDVDVEEHDVLTYSHHMTHETSNMDLDSKQEVSIQNTGLALRNVDRITQNDLKACDMFSIESSDNELLKPFKETNTEELPPVPADIVKVENVDVEDQHMTHETYNWEIDSKHEVSIQNMGPALRNVDQITQNDLKACDMLSIESSNNELLKPFKETSASLDKNTKLAEEFVNIQSALTSQHKVEATNENHIKCKSKIQTGDKHVKMKKNAIIVGVASAGKPFKCEICEKSFDRTLHLERHIRVHTGEKPYECDKCKKCFNQKQHLVQHIRVHTGEKPFKCDICGKCFNQPQILERHIRVHTGEKPYECDICKKCFNQKQHLVLHIRVHTGEKPFKCDICGKSFSRPQILEQHIRVHTGEKPFKCDICKKCYIRRSHLVRHAHTHTDEKPYKCNICEKRFNFKQNLVKHNRLHTGQKSYNCNICDKSFNQKHNLVEHINVHTGERPYKCDLCEKCFKRQQDLTLHSRMHTGENLYKCDVCAKCFYQKQHLILHNRKHTGEKRYKCDVCDKTFNLNQNLKVHIRTHTGEKPYKCDVCAKGFSQKQLLILHNYKHTGEKPYKCNACYRAFTTKQKLKKHVGRQTCELSYKCDKCGKHYSLKQNFTRHVRMQHKGDEASPLLQSHGSDVIDVPPVRRPLKCYSRKK